MWGLVRSMNAIEPTIPATMAMKEAMRSKLNALLGGGGVSTAIAVGG
ncbi:MAG: hypothetical protein ACRENH_03760 [Gemmatimonadaceae bacterium]